MTIYQGDLNETFVMTANKTTTHLETHSFIHADQPLTWLKKKIKSIKTNACDGCDNLLYNKLISAMYQSKNNGHCHTRTCSF